MPFGHTAYRANALLPGSVPLEVSFSEATPEALRFDVEPPASADLGATRRRFAALMANSVGHYFGASLAADFAARAEAAAGRADDQFALFVGCVCDHAGLTELKAYYPLRRSPVPLAAAARATLPGLRDLMHAVSVRASGVADRVYLVSTRQLDTLELEPLLCRFGLAHRLPELVMTIMRLTGNSFVLAPSSCVIGLREFGGNVELKVEILLPGVVSRAAVDALGAMFADRPASQAAFRRWLDAVALPGAATTPTVVSAKVSQQGGVRLTIYAHPVPKRPDTSADNERKLTPVLG